MGTRSKTSFIKKVDGEQIHLVSIYQQYDGYISGVGHEIADYILNKELVNGIPLSYNKSDIANGFDCLVAQFIRDFKTEVGGLYITTQDNIQEYNYDVIFDEDLYFDVNKQDVDTNDYFEIIVTDWNNNTIFKGTLKDLLNYKDEEENYG